MIIIGYNNAVCLYGNDGGNYTESKVTMIFDYCNEDCKRCSGCIQNATIHHSINDID